MVVKCGKNRSMIEIGDHSSRERSSTSRMSTPRILYVGAHDADFLVRAGGTLAKYARRGSRVVAVSLTLGELRESTRLWSDHVGITLEEVARIRQQECSRCAEILGCELRVLGWADAPIWFDRQRIQTLAELIQEIQPAIVMTHWPEEHVNTDHAVTARAVESAIQVAASAGFAAITSRDPWRPAAVYFTEPVFPFSESVNYAPNVWVDITETYELKQQGLAVLASHGMLERSYSLCADFRGYQAQLHSNDAAITFAEAFVMPTPYVGAWLPIE